MEYDALTADLRFEQNTSQSVSSVYITNSYEKPQFPFQNIQRERKSALINLF